MEGNETPKTLVTVFLDGREMCKKMHQLNTITEIQEEMQEENEGFSKKALKSILQKCTYLPGLEPLLYDAPSNILEHVVCQLSKVLSNDRNARCMFVTSGGLKKLQEIEAEPGSAIQTHINSVKSYFSEEMLRFCDPTYLGALVDQIE